MSDKYDPKDVAAVLYRMLEKHQLAIFEEIETARFWIDPRTKSLVLEGLQLTAKKLANDIPMKTGPQFLEGVKRRMPDIPLEISEARPDIMMAYCELHDLQLQLQAMKQ